MSVQSNLSKEALPQVFFDALQYFAHTGDVACLLAPQRMLLGVHNLNGDTALHTAILGGRTDAALNFARVMIAEDLDISNSEGQSALHLAVMLGQSTVAHALVQRGASIATRDNHGNTPVHLLKNSDVARALLRAAKPEEVKRVLREFNDNGQAPLHVAAAQGRLDVVLELVARHGADVNSQDTATGRTALHHAVRANNKAVCELLLEYEADVNAADHTGSTPLHAAVQYDLFDITKLLVDFGADCVANNAYFQTPIDLAMHYGSTDASRAMLAYPSIRMPSKNLGAVAAAAFPLLAHAQHRATPAVQTHAAPRVHQQETPAADSPRKPEVKTAPDASPKRAAEVGRNNSEGEWQMLDSDDLTNEGETEWHLNRNKRITTGVDKLAKYFNQKRKTVSGKDRDKIQDASTSHSSPLRSTTSRHPQFLPRTSSAPPSSLAGITAAPAPAPASSAKAEKARLAAQYGAPTDVSVSAPSLSAKDEKKMLERKYQPKIQLEVSEQQARRTTDTATTASLTKAAEAAASALANRIRPVPGKFDELSTLD